MPSLTPDLPGLARRLEGRPRDEGASEVIGSILMVAITVAVAAGLVSVLFGAVQGDDSARRASLSGGLHAGDGGWGTGDETVTITHQGGHELPVGAVAIVIEVEDQAVRFGEGGSPLDHAGEDAFDDGEMTIGERWTTTPLTVPARTTVFVQVVDTEASDTIWSSSFRSGSVTSSFVQTPLGMVTGTAANDDAARSATDDEAAATLTEEQTGTESTTTHHYGSTSSGNATNTQNAESDPDDSYATLDADKEYVQVSSFTDGVGSITKVELAMEAKHDGGADFRNVDQLRLSHDQGSTSQTYTLTTSDTQNFLDVTADKSWTWTDIQNLGVRATCECRDHQNDVRVFSVDALWVRVTATAPVYELETDAWTFDPLDTGDTHTLELRYKTNTDEEYQVQIWDGSTWTTQSPSLTHVSFNTFSETLTTAEVDAGPQMRILDGGVDDSRQGSLDLDYVRVVTS